MQQLFAGADHHSEDRGLPERWTKTLDLGTQVTSIEGLSHERSTRVHAARRSRMVVSKCRSEFELQSSFLLIEFNGFRHRLQKGVDPRRIEMLSRLMLQIHPCHIRI